MVPAPARAAAYGLAGSAVEAAFTSAVASASARRPVVRGPSTWLMLGLYALALPLVEPLHDRVRSRPWWLRGVVYAGGVFAVEAASGWTLRRLTGRCPWDYTGRTPFSIDGLIRLDYVPLWAALGVATERFHDRLVGATSPAQRNVPKEPRVVR